jgi:hypothetical protein
MRQASRQLPPQDRRDPSARPSKPQLPGITVMMTGMFAARQNV